MAVNPINHLPERGHEHELIPLSENHRADRILQVWSRCICGLEERRTYQVDETGEPLRPTRLEYRLGGVWMTALDLIRRREIPAEECVACAGDGCEACLGLGATEGGEAVRVVRQATVSEPARSGWYDPDLDRIVHDDEGRPA